MTDGVARKWGSGLLLLLVGPSLLRFASTAVRAEETLDVGETGSCARCWHPHALGAAHGASSATSCKRSWSRWDTR